MAAPRATQPRERGARAQAGAFRIGDTAGTLENIVACKLHRPGSVGFVSKSGGMSNEMYNVLARVTDGLYEGPHLPAAQDDVGVLHGEGRAEAGVRERRHAAGERRHAGQHGMRVGRPGAPAAQRSGSANGGAPGHRHNRTPAPVNRSAAGRAPAGAARLHAAQAVACGSVHTHHASACEYAAPLQLSPNAPRAPAGIAIGGDVFPGSTLSDHCLRYENIPQIKLIVVLGELGGTDEYSLVRTPGPLFAAAMARGSGCCCLVRPPAPPALPVGMALDQRRAGRQLCPDE